jgi:hypothetical protein
MDPAYEIHLNEQELAQLGKLTSILGQVDDLLIQTVERLLSVNRDAANKIMGSSKIGDNVAIWTNVINNRTSDEDVLWFIEIASKEIEVISCARNDFIHGIFSNVLQMADGFSVPSYPTVARRVRNTKFRPMSELPSVIDKAARISCLVAHIDHLIAGNPASGSAWLQRLGPTLPPRLDTVSERKAKARRGRRKPSHR